MIEVVKENIRLDKFREEYCKTCGSQQCTGKDECLEECKSYCEYVENPDMSNVQILDKFFNHINSENANKYVLIDEVSKLHYCIKNNVVYINVYAKLYKPIDKILIDLTIIP